MTTTATTSIANLWWVAGCVYSLAGSLLLCLVVFQGQPPNSHDATPPDAYRLRRLGEQWLDARIGAVLIVIGFFLQATGAAASAPFTGPGAFMLLALAFAAAYYGMMRATLAEEVVLSGGLSLRGLLGMRQPPTLALAPPAHVIAHSAPPPSEVPVETHSPVAASTDVGLQQDRAKPPRKRAPAP
jgi:hypothetical protein